MSRVETRQAIRAINASLRVMDARGYSNLHDTLLNRAQQLGALVRYDKNNRPYIGTSNNDIDAMNINLSRLQGLAEKSKISNVREKHRTSEKQTKQELEKKVEKSEYVTNWLKDNKYSLYALEEERTQTGRTSATAKRSQNILDEMEKGYYLDVEKVYDTIVEMQRKDKKELEESEILLTRLGKNKSIRIKKL